MALPIALIENKSVAEGTLWTEPRVYLVGANTASSTVDFVTVDFSVPEVSGTLTFDADALDIRSQPITLDTSLTPVGTSEVDLSNPVSMTIGKMYGVLEIYAADGTPYPVDPISVEVTESDTVILEVTK